MLTEYENSFIQAIFDSNRIPLWIFNRNYELQDYFMSDLPQDLRKKLMAHIGKLISGATTPGFDILCRENELYYYFSFEHDREPFFLFGGPMLLSGIYHRTEMKTLSFAVDMSIKELTLLVDHFPVVSLNSFGSNLRIMMLLLKKSAPSFDEICNYKLSDPKDALKHSLTLDLFEHAEDTRMHTPYSHELALLNCIKDGDVVMLESLYRTLPEIKYGDMSNNSNPVRQLFYGSIANTTLSTRYAIEGGLDEETAFTLSDLYIKRMERCNTLYELNILNEKMAIDFTKHVAEAKTIKNPDYTQPIRKCIDYIFGNLHNKISLTTLAKDVNMTPKYLSFLFHKETGQTISSFIEEARINKAKNLLIYSQFSYSEISQYLLFNSQSYFISIFKKHVGMTPKKFRNLYSKSSW